MKIIAQVNWFDEPPALLRRCIASMAPLVDSAISSVDGPYKLFPHERVSSPMEQWEEIQAACLDHGIHCEIYGKNRPWESQVEKRTFMFLEACAMGEVFDDYTLVIDADEVIECVCVDRLRHRLLDHRPEACTVTLNTPGGDRYHAVGGPAMHGIQNPRFSTDVHGRGVERIFQLMLDPEVGPQYHGTYSGTNRRAERVTLKHRGADMGGVTHAAKMDMTDLITIRNDTWSRPVDRIQAKDLYGRKRRQENIDL